ncbi:TonB-dependent receptor [Sphingomonas colocasiae]|uniref:TonB-dependent receptor n=1 Tax=Sphingomonas colocasiae TaxID=1848973 RepID=A0ABS7PV24_9SPHN|nr:TonB-dependent receptor [Sphingomonas colocasiae]MBY8825001.1 TonB-dependent receptor [Sphingomonas colocasiae]
MRTRIALFTASAAFALMAGTAHAQAQQQPQAATSAAGESFDDEIVVTAQRRSESVQDVPISISAFSGKQLQELKITQPADVAAISPGVFVNATRGDQNPTFSIRGLSLNDTFSNNNPTVGIYFDDVNLPYTPMMSFQMFDIARVEVLKGPQGTLYGRNTTGGAINFISRKPTHEPEAYATLSYGRFDRLELEGAAGGGVTDTLAVRFSARTVQQSGGWQTNALTGKTIGDVNSIAVRGQALWTPTPELTVNLQGTYVYNKSDQQLREHVGYYAKGGSGYCAAALAGKLDPTTCVDRLGYSDPTPGRRTVENSATYGYENKSRSEGVALNVAYDFGGVTLTSITGYNHFNRVSGDDSDGGALIELDTRFTDDIKSFTQELRLTSDNDSPLSWVAGVYYSWDRIAGNALQALDDHFFHTRVDTGFVQKTDAYAVFGQANYKLTDALTLTAGLRFTRDDKRFTYDSIDLNPYGNSTLPVPVAGIVDGVKQDNLSGKIGIDYKVSPDVMLYASASRGFKSGGFKAAIAFNPEELRPFKGETVYSYEVGAKTSLLDGALTFNLAGYYNDWRDFQAMVTEIRSGINVIVLSNAGDARVYGLEAEATYRPTDRLTLRGALNWQSSKITDFNNAPGADDFTGNRLSNAPAFSASAMARWETPIQGDDWGVAILSDASYRSKTFYSLANRNLSAQDGYWLVNGRLAVHDKDDRWEAAIYGRNLLNKLYVASAYDNWGGIFPSQNFLGDPATYGVSLTVRF